MKMIKMKQEGIAKKAQRALIYGEPKCGKTESVGRALADLPQIEKVIWFDLEDGATTLLKLPDETLEKIELIRVKDKAKDPVALTTMMHVIEGGPVDICDAHGTIKSKCVACKKNPDSVYIRVCLDEEDYKTLVVIDSFTQLSKSALFHAVKNSGTDLADLDLDEKATFNHYGAHREY